MDDGDEAFENKAERPPLEDITLGIGEPQMATSSPRVMQAEEAFLRRVEVQEAKIVRRRVVSRYLTILRGIAFFGAIIAISFIVWRYVLPRYPSLQQALDDNGWLTVLAGLFGVAVGASELVSRYRDAPLRALGSLSAGIYLSLNAIISMCAYGLLTRYSEAIIPALADDPLLRSIAAGFGAMAILRSKFFTLRTEGGEEIGVGPDAAISIFLSAADRGVDRKRAGKRLDLVFERVGRVTGYSDVKNFIKVSLRSFQNLNKEEQQQINEKIEEIYEKNPEEYPGEELKLQALCYEVLVIVGEHNFNQLIDNLESFMAYIKSKKKEEEAVRAALVQELHRTVQETEEMAKREAEEAKREAEEAKREAEEAKREAEEQAKREAEEQAGMEASNKVSDENHQGVP